MELLTIFALAVALAMDAFAVAIGVGISLKKASFRQTFRLSWHFGLFQALMPVIGWSAGLTVRTYMESYGHWIAFGLLLLVGGNMIGEALRQEQEDSEKKVKDATKGATLVVLSLATSIDALAVGFSLSLLQVSIVTPALIIGLVAGMFTLIGLYLGEKLAAHPRVSSSAEILGGLVLWGIGCKILYENDVFSFL